jgi:hypothetical protein
MAAAAPGRSRQHRREIGSAGMPGCKFIHCDGKDVRPVFCYALPGLRGALVRGGRMSQASVKEQVRALLDRLPDDCTFADVQRAIAVLMWPKQDDGRLEPPQRLPPEEVKRRLRAWLKSEKDG